MCLGLPMQIIRREGLRALCQYRGEQREIDLSLVGEQPPGSWVMTFLDTAREVLSEDDAKKTLAALAALETVMGGGEADIDALFSDLAGRDPPLPPHFKPDKPINR